MSRSPEQRPLDDRLEALARFERRRLLLDLSTTNPDDEPRVDFGEVDEGASELDPLVAMRHLHLPVLEERGFVRWDRENHRVTRGPRFGEIEPLLEVLRELRDELPGEWT